MVADGDFNVDVGPFGHQFGGVSQPDEAVKRGLASVLDLAGNCALGSVDEVADLRRTRGHGLEHDADAATLAVVAPPVLVERSPPRPPADAPNRVHLHVDDRHGRKDSTPAIRWIAAASASNVETSDMTSSVSVQTELRVEPFDRRRQVREQTLPLVPQFLRRQARRSSPWKAQY